MAGRTHGAPQLMRTPGAAPPPPGAQLLRLAELPREVPSRAERSLAPREERRHWRQRPAAPSLVRQHRPESLARGAPRGCKSAARRLARLASETSVGVACNLCGCGYARARRGQTSRRTDRQEWSSSSRQERPVLTTRLSDNPPYPIWSQTHVVAHSDPSRPRPASEHESGRSRKPRGRCIQ